MSKNFDFVCSKCKEIYLYAEVIQGDIITKPTGLCPLCSGSIYVETTFKSNIDLYRILINLIETTKTPEMLLQDKFDAVELRWGMCLKQKAIIRHNLMCKKRLKEFERNKTKQHWLVEAQNLPFGTLIR